MARWKGVEESGSARAIRGAGRNQNIFDLRFLIEKTGIGTAAAPARVAASQPRAHERAAVVGWARTDYD